MSEHLPDHLRLNKRMAELGLCSRREADDWIAQGWVQVNGQRAEMGMQVTPSDRITVSPAAKGQQKQLATILLNKPVGLVSGQAESGHPPAASLVQSHTRWRDDLKPDSKALFPSKFQVVKEHAHFQLAFMARMIFSCLVDADFKEVKDK